MKNSVAMVVLGVDKHLERIATCVNTIRLIYEKKVDIAVATFGNSALPPSELLSEYCQENDIIFYDSPRQDFLIINKENTEKYNTHNGRFTGTTEEFHSSEIIGKVAISKYFYDRGYSEVYLLHNDVLVVRDFLKMYRKNMVKNWAFVSPYIQSTEIEQISLESVSNIDREQRKQKARNKEIGSRIALSVLILNKKLVNSLYRKYKNEKNMHKNYLNKFCMVGDIGFLQLFDDFNGFSGYPIEEEVALDCWWSKDTSLEYIISNHNISHLHGMELFDKYKKNIKDIILKTKIK